MKVGTDGVLLGAWASINDRDVSILDIGTGTGLIAIMMAQRSPATTKIVGVEIDSDSAHQAAENMAASPWADQLSVINTPIQSYAPSQKFDLILSNPPYFVNSLTAKGDSRTTARHTTELSFEDLASAVERLLSNRGRFVLILPTNETQLFDQATKGMLHLSRRCYVRGKVGGSIKRIISEYTLAEVEAPSESEISIRDKGVDEYSPEYRDLTADFYLKF